MTTSTRAGSGANAVLAVAPAAPAEAAAHFAARLASYTDVSDVAAALSAGADPGFVLLDSRSTESWEQGHVPGAVHLPTALIPGRAEQLLDRSVPVVTYCWGPGCDGAARAALALALLGYPVKEMLGGIEYWIREGFEIETGTGPGAGPQDTGRREQREPDPLTTPRASASCGC
ncbi:rhodanese-like domain-containing protein [Streptomyces niveus]|uniref:rhodanese-like domain-containing protein n=1 Tax=Streptomyces niveus TaxID=193462 RepID=UPI0033E1A256